MGVTIGRIDPDNTYAIVCNNCGGASDWDVTITDYREDPKKYDEWICPDCVKSMPKRRINNQKVEGQMTEQPLIEVYADGGCKNNGAPDAKAYGTFAVFYNGKRKRTEPYDFPQYNTSNQAEHKILLCVLQYLTGLANSSEKQDHIQVKIYMDSKLTVNRANGVWVIKKDTPEPLKVLMMQIFNALSAVRMMPFYGVIEIIQVPREEIEAVLGH